MLVSIVDKKSYTFRDDIDVCVFEFGCEDLGVVYVLKGKDFG